VTLTKKLQFEYDYLGRRISKKVYPWSTGLNDWGAATNHTLFLYDGWNLIAELDGFQSLHPLPLVRSYTWGLDLTGSLDETAGIGGLVLATDHGASAHYYPSYDGNGNVSGLVKSDGTVAALYEYSPFGEIIRASGAGAYRQPFLFSTKYYDWETGLSYYGHRYYSSALGRWINEDPIEEEGGSNLYAFVGNNPVNGIDYLGAAPKRSWKDVLSAMHKDLQAKKPGKGKGWDHAPKDIREFAKDRDQKGFFREKGRKRGGKGDRGWSNKTGAAGLAMTATLATLTASYIGMKCSPKLGPVA
jgi:RHS repeat-associated protein